METSSITLADPTTQHTLGIEWNTKSDNFVVRTNVPDRPFTKRGVLATCNSTFDPLGFVSPIILTGRILQRILIPAKSSDPTLANLDWDDPLPSEYLSQWNDWKASLRSVDSKLSLPRCYFPSNFGAIVKQELPLFL